jgi:hypothetical protein
VHGIIFAGLGDYVRDSFGKEAEAAVFAGEAFSMSRAHSDEAFLELLTRAVAASGMEAPAFLHDFGRFTGERTFPALYPAFYELAGGTLPFLLNVETHIHELVRATVPEARPPALRASAAGERSVTVDYQSARQLCSLARGLIQGTADYYGDAIRIAEPQCMLQGAASCQLVVELA